MTDGERDEEKGAPGEDDDESHLDTSETSGLGLTEEFERIEAEIEETFDTGEHPKPAEREPEPAEPRSDTAEDWITEEEAEASSREGHYGETGEYDAVPETGEWTAEHEAVPEPPPDEDMDSAEFPVIRPASMDSAEHEAVPAAEESAEHEAVAEPEPADEAVAEPEPADEEPAEQPQPPKEAPASDAETVVQRPEEGAEAPIAAAAAAAASAPPTPAADPPTEVRPAPSGTSGQLTPIPPSIAGGYSGPPAISDDELDLKVPSLWLRFMSASVIIVMSVAASVAVAGLLFLGDVAAKLQPIPGIQEQLDQIGSGDPATILIVGSDRRSSDAKEIGARSDTTMLLRVDPEKDVLSLFSLPRDLQVNIPGYGVGKLNEAYTVGGIKKTLATVTNFTGQPINHVVEINFYGFADAVNAIDCVYVDVDRDYFNDNSTALSAADTYAAIDINAGYQRLCGEKALQYVRYRHTDTDLVRAARQQDFLREARQKVEPRELIPAPIVGGDTGNELIDIFTSYTRSDIDDSSDVLGILKSFVDVREVPVNKVEFQGDIGDATNTYVTSTSEQMEAAIDEFLNGPPAPEGGDGGGDGGSDKKKNEDKEKDKEKEDGGDDPLAGSSVMSTSDLTDPETGEVLADQFEADANKNFRRLGIPVFYPKYVVPGSSFDIGSRTYEYENEEDKEEEAYKTVIAYQTPSTLTEYYGVMGTTWDDPPILRNPSETRDENGEECDPGGKDCHMFFYDGDRLRMIGWQEDGNSYWLNNTLTTTLDEPDMVAIARTMGEVNE
jgi:LCP family protein required for cell wall assembly